MNLITVSPSIGIISAMAGVLASLLFSYVPGLNTWFASKEKQYKQLFMLGMGVVVSLGLVGLACLNVINGIVCNQEGIVQVLVVLGGWVVGNQSAYSISPPTTSVIQTKVAKEAIDSMKSVQ